MMVSHRYLQALVRTRYLCPTAIFKQCISKVPQKPCEVPVGHGKTRPPATKIDKETVELLERLSLVNFSNERGIEILEAAIQFADELSVVDTEGVEPLITVLENRDLPLREDVVADGNCRDKILSNAHVTEEEYFVAPPGNVPLLSVQPSTVDRDRSETEKLKTVQL